MALCIGLNQMREADMNESDHAVYARIAEELETGSADKGLWTYCFAECDGDEPRTKAQYIRMRAEVLMAESQSPILEPTMRSSNNDRCLNFPTDQNIGSVIWYPQSQSPINELDMNAWSSFDVAQGRIAIHEDMIASLCIDCNDTSNDFRESYISADCDASGAIQILSLLNPIHGPTSNGFVNDYSHVKYFHNLRYLIIGGWFILGDGFQEIAKISTLESLYITAPFEQNASGKMFRSGYRISDEDLGLLCQLPNLYSLELDSNCITIKSLRQLAKISSLKTLKIQVWSLSDDDLKNSNKTAVEISSFPALLDEIDVNWRSILSPDIKIMWVDNTNDWSMAGEDDSDSDW
jgi:hypothetical protein